VPRAYLGKGGAVPRNLAAMSTSQSRPSNLHDLPTEILLQITDWIRPFFRARTLPLVSRRFYHLEKQFWFDCRPPCFSKRLCPKQELAQRFPCLKPGLQRCLMINASSIPMQTILISSSYVVLSHLLLTKASEAQQLDTKTSEDICRSLANVCCSAGIPNDAMRLRNAAKAQARRTCPTLLVHIVDIFKAVILRSNLHNLQPISQISS
jgi:hypothetical protein